MKQAIQVAGTLLVLAGSASAAELVLGSVHIAVGAPVAPVIANLQHEFAVRVIEGGWEVRSRDPKDVSTPLVGLGAKSGRLQNVSFGWGPGVTPSLEELFTQLTHALPADAECHIQSFTRPLEGGTVRTVIHQCDGITVEVGVGVWPQGNTAHISINQE
jgi:hypothetical protein